jgi:hypothetical protein
MPVKAAVTGLLVVRSAGTACEMNLLGCLVDRNTVTVRAAGLVASVKARMEDRRRSDVGAIVVNGTRRDCGTRD